VDAGPPSPDASTALDGGGVADATSIDAARIDAAAIDAGRGARSISASCGCRVGARDTSLPWLVLAVLALFRGARARFRRTPRRTSRTLRSADR